MKRGLLVIHSCPMALIRHVDWSIQSVVDRVQIDWRNQPLDPGTQRATIEWRSSKDLSAELASALKSWHYLRFELHEAPSNGVDGSLFMFVPDLGIYRGSVNSHGDLMLNENQVTSCIRSIHRHHDVITELERALGKPWDDELDCYRRAIAEDGLSELSQLSI